MFRYFLVGLFLFWGLLSPLFIIEVKTSLAASTCEGIIITEIMPNPSPPLSDTTDEWIELKNTGANASNIGGCKLKDLKGSVKEFIIPENTIIQPAGFLTFYNRETKISLNNDADGVVFQSSDGSPVSETAIYKNAPDGQSYLLNNGTWEWSSDVTPGFEKSKEDTASDTSSNSCEGLIVSELLPDPVSPLTDTADEWIEIYNETEEPINIGGCILTDTYKPGSTREYQIKGGSLAPGGFIVFYSKETKISLNNTDGDSIRILSPQKKIIFETENYHKSKAGQSWAFDGEKWFWTVATTAGALNILEILEEEVTTKKSTKKDTKTKNTSKPKTKSKPVSKSSGSPKKKSGNGSEVLGASTEDENSLKGKINDKLMGYILVTLAGVLLVGYVIFINKEFIYENIIKKFGRNS